ncbi:MAG TPA: glycosyltransferase family 2 protein [Candidatus Angelobacter sp.]|jgi:dolichol-phosphate mannosyltransferase|nr:glycosyltransferase family 2 protein [Candidatus Angelobacter sp.]
MPDAVLLSVVVPTRNEAGNVGPLVDRLFGVLQGVDAELCFVDDSDDETPALLERLMAAHPGRVRCRFRSGDERAGGLSTAVVAGLRMAAGRYVCVMDADLQHPPETIRDMLDEAQRGADLVVGSRYVAGGSTGGLDGTARRVVSRGATRVAQVLFSEARQTADPLSGFFLCRRALLDGIEFRPVGFKILLELLVCVPGIEVRDVPLRFQPRSAGESKASMGQGLLYLRHLRSLFVDVRGSARPWKFALVGLSGMAVFLPLLWLLTVYAGIRPLVAFVPAFVLSVAWNTTLNRMWTFADRRRRAAGEGPWRYLRGTLLSGLLVYSTFTLLFVRGLHEMVAAVLATLVGMVANFVVNNANVRSAPAVWGRLAMDRGVQASLARLAEQVGADRAYLLPAERGGPSPAGVPAELLDRVVRLARPAAWTEAPSHRPQRRTNIESTSLLLVPAVRDGKAVAVVVCERRAPRGFLPEALETATRAVDALASQLVAEPSVVGAVAPAQV